MDAFDEFGRAFKRGRWNQSSLARAVGASQGAVWHWLNRRKRPGREFAFELQKVLGIRAERWATATTTVKKREAA